MPPSPGAPDANMMMQQIQQLQKTVMQLQTSSGQGQGGGTGTGGTNTFRGNGSINEPGTVFGGEPGSNNGGAIGGGYMAVVTLREHRDTQTTEHGITEEGVILRKELRTLLERRTRKFCLRPTSHQTWLILIHCSMPLKSVEL